jgi:hypothetical protein
MEKVTFDKIVGFILAILFAFVIGGSMQGLLVQPDSITSERTQDTMRIVGMAGALAALLAWWVQGFAATRGFVVRFLFALFVFVVAFCSLGGLFRVIDGVIRYPNQQDWSFMGIYWASQGNLISFVIDMLVPPRPAYAGLILAAAAYLALFGPRQSTVVVPS